MAAEKALTLLRTRLCNNSFIHSAFKSSPNTPYSKLKFLISTSVSEACNNSVLLLGPRGSGKNAVAELVIEDLSVEYPDSISVVRLSGLLHCDDNCALKEIARQLRLEYQLSFSKMASSDDNSLFMINMLKECGLAHKTIVFILDEFDLFAQGKQRFLYSLLDAMQTLTSQAVVVGISCRLDADQLLEKRVRSRFSHRKILFIPPSPEDIKLLLEHLLYLPKDSGLPSKYVTEFNSKLENIFLDKKFDEIINSVLDVDRTVSSLVRFLFRAVSFLDMQSGLVSLDNFRNAQQSAMRQPKSDSLQDASVVELYILVCMNRLETKEQNAYNFNSVMKEYKAIHDTYKTSDNYAHAVCLRAFEHLLQRELIGYTDNKGRGQSIEFRTVKLLISPHELHHGLKSDSSCPAILKKLLEHESFK